MTITTLLLEKYDVSPITGFLPSKPPLKRLSNEYFAPWENMMDDFNDLLLAGKLREKIHKASSYLYWIPEGYKQLKNTEEHS
ncbi:hypothetical protein G6F34_008519 [Rhizopus arrhizus]|nr:hypothetical protein G6F34_008519 [Rhizopus arrhizus]